MPALTTIQQRKAELIRKATDYSLFIGGADADPVVKLTELGAGGKIDLAPLPTGYKDVGWTNSDGLQLGREVTASEITSAGSSSPTRTDMKTDVVSVTVNMQETNALTIEIITGAAKEAIVADKDTGEVKLVKPNRPSARQYKGVAIAVDDAAAGPIYMARYWPVLKVSSFGQETWQPSADEALLRTVTFGTNPDASGSSETWFFGGPGWEALLTEMGVTRAP